MIWMPPTGPTVTPPQAVANSELSARSVHQSSGFKKGKEGEEDKVTFRAFEPPRDPNDRSKRVREISVDRCQYLTESQAVTLAWGRAPARGGDFYGWAIISAEDVRGCGAQVVSSPPVDQSNPAHGDIVLPQGDTDDDQGRNLRLAELATASCWQYAPTG
jgi:hypothetical protein